MLSSNGQAPVECPDAIDEVTDALSDLGLALAGEEDLRTYHRYVRARALTEQLAAALRSRAVIRK